MQPLLLTQLLEKKISGKIIKSRNYSQSHVFKSQNYLLQQNHEQIVLVFHLQMKELLFFHTVHI